MRFLLKKFGDEIRQIEGATVVFLSLCFSFFFFFTKLYCTLKSVEKTLFNIVYINSLYYGLHAIEFG